MKIFFYFPYREVSGVPVLFLNLAEYFASKYPDIIVAVIDYPDGYMASNRNPDLGIVLMPFSDGKAIYINDGYVIMQSILPYAIRPELKLGDKSRVIFWNLFPENFLPQVFPFSVLYNNNVIGMTRYKLLLNIFWGENFSRLREFVFDAVTRNALHFMDSSNLNKTKEILDLHFEKLNLLPIASSGVIGSFAAKKKFFSKRINIAFIGRLVNFKYRSVEFLLIKLNEIAQRQKLQITFYVVGDGPFKAYLQNLNYKNNYLKTEFTGTIQKSKLDDFLLNNIDINISMGTAALESARLYIPTILIDYCYQNISADYKFRWLHETTHFDLGHLIKSSNCDIRNDSLEEMILVFMENPSSVGQLSFEYFKRNHSIESVSEKVLAIINEGIPAFGDFNKKYFKKSLIRKLYEYKKYKI